jgi:hypothetical protein
MDLDKEKKISSFAGLIHIFCMHWEDGYDPHSFHDICDEGSLEDQPSSHEPLSHDISYFEEEKGDKLVEEHIAAPYVEDIGHENIHASIHPLKKTRFGKLWCFSKL